MAIPLLVVAGIGDGSGTGAATARLFAQEGYRIALIARNPAHLDHLTDEIKKLGGDAAGFPIPNYSYGAIITVFDTIFAHKWATEKPSELRAALWNAGVGVWKTFLEISEQEILDSLQVNVTAAFAFSRRAILAFKENKLDERGKRGTLIFTGATAALRGNIHTSAFSAAKHASRALSQSLAKEFGKDNIHVAHVVIDGVILTDATSKRYGPAKEAIDWQANMDMRLNPESIAKNYLFLAQQDRSAWSWELDLRPAHEKW